MLIISHCKTIILDQGGVEHTDPPFEWIEFRRKDGIYILEIDITELIYVFILGEVVKGTVLPPIHRENDVKIPKHVPIVNMVLEESNRDQCPANPEHKTYEAVQLKETPKPQTVSCDAGTQTEKVDKKGGCLIM